MKKLVFLVIATLVAMGSFAQNMNVQTAFNYLKKNKWRDAFESIQPALEHAQTSTQAKTWYYYTKICLAISQDSTGAYTGLLADPLGEAARGCTKALEFDTKQEYEDELPEMMFGIAGLYRNNAITAFEAKSYAEAADNFIKAYELTERLGKPDMSMLMYAGNCYLSAENWDKAEEVFTKLKDANYDNAMVYVGLAKVAVAKKELNKAVKYLDEGEQKYPKDLLLLTEKANMYMVGELSELDKHAALNTLKKIVALEPNNASVWNSLGACYALDADKFDEAAAAYLKCIEINPQFTSAYYGYSNLYLDKANGYIKEAQDLPIEEQKKYDELIKQSETVFMEVLPFVEKAHALDPSDGGVKAILKEIYTRLKMMDKAAELK
jgi:tetratricopeptide (TPR) repeat protein